MLFAALRVAAELEAADSQVSVALRFDGSFQYWGQRVLVLPENKIIGGLNAMESAIRTKKQRIVQNARTLQNRAAAGATAEDRNRVAFAERAMDFTRNLITIT